MAKKEKTLKERFEKLGASVSKGVVKMNKIAKEQKDNPLLNPKGWK